MISTEELLKFLSANNIFAPMYMAGSKPHEVRRLIVTTLGPFFRNRQALDRYVLDFLVPDYVNLLRARTRYPGIDGEVQLVLGTYYRAIEKSPSFLIAAIRRLTPLIIETGNRFWAFVNLEKDKSQLETHEFVKASFDDMAGIVEELLKPHLVEQVVVHRIAREKPADPEVLVGTKLGVLVDELVGNSLYPHLFIVPPEGLKLSTWRNIASHRSYHVSGSQIVCEYRVGGKAETLSLSREDLFQRVRQITRTLEVLNFAHKFFAFDNMTDISKGDEPSRPPHTGRPGRDEMWLLFYVTGLNSLGFDVIDLQFVENGEALLVVEDLTGEDPKTRGLHASQFTYSLWLWTGAASATVEYRLKIGKPYLRATVDAEICRSIRNGEHGIEYLADNVQFQLL